MSSKTYQSKRPISRKIKEQYSAAKKKYGPQIKSGALKFFEAVKKIKVQEVKQKQKRRKKISKRKCKRR